MNSHAATMKRKGFGYVMAMTVTVPFAGAAGMYALEKPNLGFDTYGMTLWWIAMRVITAGYEFNPSTPEGRGLAFIIAIFGYTIFGNVTATSATFFIGRDAEEEDARVAGTKDMEELGKTIQTLSNDLQELKAGLK